MAKGKPNLAEAIAKRDEANKTQSVSSGDGVEEIQSKIAPVKSRSDRSDQTNISGWFPKTVKFTLDLKR